MELQDIVNRLRMNQSIKAIKRETGKHRSVIRRVLQLAEQEGWLDEQQELPSEQQLQEVYHEQRIGEEGRVSSQPPFPNRAKQGCQRVPACDAGVRQRRTPAVPAVAV